jgi:hypothetical protein
VPVAHGRPLRNVTIELAAETALADLRQLGVDTAIRSSDQADRLSLPARWHRLLADLADTAGLSTAMCHALAPLQQRDSGHDPGRVAVDVAVMLAGAVALWDRGARSADGRPGSDRASELGEPCGHPLGAWRVNGEFVVTAAEVLHERIPGFADARCWCGHGVFSAAARGLPTRWWNRPGMPSSFACLEDCDRRRVNGTTATPVEPGAAT